MTGTLLIDPNAAQEHAFSIDAVRRRSSVVSMASSTPTRRASAASITLMNPSRLPLAPLGPQLTPAFVYADPLSLQDHQTSSKPARASLSDDSLPRTLVTNLNNTSWYPSVSPQTRLISTPARMQENYTSRRTSLPALHFSPSPALPALSNLGRVQPPPPADSRLFDQLQSYVLSSKRPAPDDTPRPEQTISPRASITAYQHQPVGPLQQDDGQESSDEEELARRLDRAKLRAIDDGGRRPSLPINIPTPNHPSSSSIRTSDISRPSTGVKPLPDLPSSDPGPAATMGFDLDFIFGPRQFPGGPLDLTQDPSFAATRRMSVSLDSGADAHGWEDSFTRFVNQNDHEYGERQALWSFRRSGRAQSAPQDVLGVWEAGQLGTYWVGGDNSGVNEERKGARRSSLVIRRFPTPSGSEVAASILSPYSTPSSAVRIHIHNHSRAPAHSLFLGNLNPSSAGRTSILLATKKVHLHASSRNDKDRDVTPTKSRDRTRSFSRKAVATTEMSSPPSSPPRVPNVSSASPTKIEDDDDFEEFRLPQRPPPPGYIPPFVNPNIHESNQMILDTPRERSNDHAAAFATVGPEVREMLLDQIRSRHTIGGRIKRVLGAGPPSPSNSVSHAHMGSGSHGMIIESTYTPPWMLMAPGYLKEENERKIKRLQSSFETAGFFPPPRSKSKREKVKLRISSDTRQSRDTARSQSVSMATSNSHSNSYYDSPHAHSPTRPPMAGPSNTKRAGATIYPTLELRNDLLESVAGDTMCMAVPLWDFRGEESGGDNSPVSKQHNLSFTHPSDRKWLFITYVPFAAEATTSSIHSPLGSIFRSSQPHRSKKRPRRPSAAIPNANPPGSSSSGPLSSFRVVGRIISHAELRRSGLRYPSLAGGPEIEGEEDEVMSSPSEDPPYTAVIATCHDTRTGVVEYVPEGLDCLGLCGQPPRRIVGATTPFTFERDCSALSAIGRDVMEITWAGCLALMDA